MKPAERREFASKFFDRQTIMKEIGSEGQRRLSEAKVAVVGVGGLGTVSSLYLALAGVGYLRLIDQDTIEIQNLHRQILYTVDDLQYPKVEVAAERLCKLNPLLQVEPVSENVNAGNVERLLAGMDIVVDGLDNMRTRYLVNRACVKLKVSYVFGAAIGMEGNLSVFSAPETPCLECVLPNLSDSDLQTCNTRGVLGVTPGIVGAMQAMETIKLITGAGLPLKGKLVVCDFNDMSFATVDVSRNANCTACHGEISAGLPREKLVWLCGLNTANINPEEPLKLNLNEVYETVRQRFNVRIKSHMVLVFDYKDLQVSLFNAGRLLIKNVANEKMALKAYRDIMNTLNLT